MGIVTKMTQDIKTKKEWKTLELEVEMPQGVSAQYSMGVLKVTGPKGEVSKLLRFPNVYMKVEGSKVLIGTKKFSQSEKKIIFTYNAHVKNLIKGVVEGYEYKLVVVYAKFPITAELKGSTFTVKNLLGEKVPRTVSIPIRSTAWRLPARSPPSKTASISRRPARPSSRPARN